MNRTRSIARRFVVLFLALLAAVTAVPAAQATDVPQRAAAASSSDAVWLWDLPDLVDPHEPVYMETSALGDCTPTQVGTEVMSASNLNRNWKIRFYRSTYCSGAWGYSTLWEYGSGHTYTDRCVCYSGGGAQSFRRISLG